MNFIENFIMGPLQGERILDLFETYFSSQPEMYQVLIIYGVAFLTVIGIFGIVKAVLKTTTTLLKVVVILALAYYVIFVLLGLRFW